MDTVVKHGSHDQKDHGNWSTGSRSDASIIATAQERATLGRPVDKSVIGEDGFGYTSTKTGERFDTHQVNPDGAARLIKEQGWDAPAQSVDQATFDRLAASDDFVQVWRGGPPGLERGMIEGTPFIGGGKYGPGTYVTEHRDRAANFARGSMVPMLVPSSMVVDAPTGMLSWKFDPLADHGMRGLGAVKSDWVGDYVVWNTGALIVGPPVASDAVFKQEDRYFRVVDGRAEPVEFDEQGRVTVLKHGSHDQSSHGNWSAGGGTLPSGWSRQSRERVISRWEKVALEEHGSSPEKAREFAERKADLNDYYDGPNGSVVTFERLERDISEAARERLLNQVAEMQEVAPVPGMEVTVGHTAYRYYGEDPRYTGAFAMLGEPKIFMAPRSVTTGFKNDPDWLMPSIKGNTKKYPLAHEWGHTLDKRSVGNAYDDWMAVSKLGGMSKYGRSDSRESFAEAFVDWHLTGGKTKSEAVAYYRDKYNWGSEGGVTVAKAAQETVTIVADTFGPDGATIREVTLPDPVDWELAQAALMKSVLVAFEPGLRPVLKHGDHDQKSHGNWSTGGVTLDASVAQSIIDRVRANGGLSVNMLDGSEPTTGYMVAKGGTKGAIVGADEFFDAEKGSQALGTFLKENRELSKGAYLGLWHNDADGKVYLDVSENIKDRATAIDAGRARDQISIWDVANFEEIDTGGTGQLGKAVAGSETAGPVHDDGRGDRRIRKDAVGEVRGGGVAVYFEPGLRPVLKHGDHDQSSHGNWSAGRAGSRLTPGATGESAAEARRELRGAPGKFTPPGGGSMRARSIDDEPQVRAPARETLTDAIEARREATARALMNNDFSGFDDMGSSKLARSVGSGLARIEKRIERIAARLGVEKKKRWRYSADEAARLRESYYEKYGEPRWMSKAVVVKHGSHDQKSHGNWSTGGGDGSGWGDRQADIDAMAGVGPGGEALRRAIGLDDDTVRDQLIEQWGESIEESARIAVEADMEREGWVDFSDDPDYEGPVVGNTYQQEFEQRLAERMESDIEVEVESWDSTIREEILANMGVDNESFDEVFGVSNIGTNIYGDEVALRSEVESVSPDRWGGDIDVKGSIYDGDGNMVGEFHRRFSTKPDGELTVSHELLNLWSDEHQGTGFAKVFNKRAEDYYISRGIKEIQIHSALSVGGYAWAKQGYDWTGTGAGWSVKGNIDDLLSAGSLPSGVSKSGQRLRDRLDLSPSDPDYPTPREVASWGYVRGAAGWPGKDVLMGSDWYGKKTLSPSGPRRSTTEVAAPGAEEIPGQQALFD